MSRHAKVHRYVSVSLALGCATTAWWGCAGATPESPTSSSSSSASSGSGGSGGIGGLGFDASSDSDQPDACVATSEEAHQVPLDIVFLVDQSSSMSGNKWTATTSALTQFFNDPASASVSAGLVYVPTSTGCECDFTSYMVPDVPIAPLPGNSFALTNSMPADATGACTPTYGGLKGALTGAAAYQDAHPTHKVITVFATDGETWTSFGCNPVTIGDIAGLASGVLNYNGVQTYVIGVDGSINANLNQIAAAGGTTAAYNVTLDISQFSAMIAKIRTEALGCEFEIPEPPNGQELVPDDVNFSYTPQGLGSPIVLPRADNLADCNGQPGWYYDNDNAPTKMLLCPASCATVQADGSAKVSVLFGCKSVIN